MIRKLFQLISVLIMLLLLLSVGVYIYLQNYLNEYISTSRVIFIPKGSTKSVLDHLNKSGVKMSFFDYYLIKLYGFPQAGWIDIGDQNLTRDEFYRRVTTSKAALESITLIPGETKEIFFDQIAQKLDLNSSKLIDIYNKTAPYPDGVLIAETYSVPKGIREEGLIEYLLDISLKKHKSLAKELLGSYDERVWFKRYITMASIITKEAADVDEMPLVSAVIYNRLKINMPLQMDGTLNYKRFSHTKVTPKMIREDDSLFNTYKNSGLPPHPICAVTKSAIQAAIRPADVNYLYFVKNRDGRHSFTHSYKIHLQNIKSVKK